MTTDLGEGLEEDMGEMGVVRLFKEFENFSSPSLY